MKKKVGLIINPIAGMGGKVGLKGTDGPEILKKAKEIGATPESPKRAEQALARLAVLKDDIHILTCPGQMGERVLKTSGFKFSVTGSTSKSITTANDTERAAREMKESGVDLLLFAGGDGTARNIYDAIGDSLPVLGVPAGVKMHSAVFGINPRSTGELAILYLQEIMIGTREAEVMDINEEAYRDQRVSAKLYGYLQVPFEQKMIQNVKVGRNGAEEYAAKDIALDVIKNMEEDCLYIVGPGTTTREVMNLLSLPNTLLGVDLILNKSLVANDVNERQLLQKIEGKSSRIIVTVIGGQGYIFGRGNQQISYNVLRKVGKQNVIVIATQEKIFSLKGNPLLVDSGDQTVNQMLSGYISVTTGIKEKLVCKVSS